MLGFDYCTFFFFFFNKKQKFSLKKWKATNAPKIEAPYRSVKNITKKKKKEKKTRTMLLKEEWKHIQL